MCRMFGLVSARQVTARELLRDAPKSLWALSREHKDGWGIALGTASIPGQPNDWVVHRSTECAAHSPQYGELAEALQTKMLLAHVRKKTVGETSLANTHPFRRGTFVFAHNGTIRVSALLARISPERLAEIEGDTDSERLFAFVMTHIDVENDVERGVVSAVRELHSIDDIGPATFLLSCGARMYAHRLGRSLFVLTRHEAVEERRSAAVVIASEQLTGEPWCELAEGSLIVVDGIEPQLRWIVGSSARPVPAE